MTAVVDPDAESAFAYRQRTYALDDIEGMYQGLREDGFALVPGVLSAEEVELARAAADRLEHFGFDHKKPFNDHFKCVFNRDRVWLSFADRPGIVDLAERAMGGQCHLIGMTAWRTRPGYDGRGLHTDHIFTPVPEAFFDADPSFELPIHICTAHFYLCDVTDELAPTMVIPGSHRAGRQVRPDDRSWRGREPEAVVCRAGDVLFFRSELWHSGSQNLSDSTRYMLQVHYGERSVAQKFSPWPFQYNPEILAVANERQLRLLGRHPESNYG